MNHTIGTRHIHRIEPISKRSAIRIAKHIPLNPPPRPSWAQLWRLA